ncbi:hypothetical protein TUSAK1_34490 [Klebsiella variicola]|nr:hypothetical protein NUKP74_25850 [Klebsiella quasipneumoniae]
MIFGIKLSAPIFVNAKNTPPSETSVTYSPKFNSLKLLDIRESVAIAVTDFIIFSNNDQTICFLSK